MNFLNRQRAYVHILGIARKEVWGQAESRMRISERNRWVMAAVKKKNSR